MPLASSLVTWLCAALSLSAVTTAQAKVIKTVAAPPFDLNGTRRELYFAWAAFCASNMHVHDQIEHLHGHALRPLATGPLDGMASLHASPGVPCRDLCARSHDVPMHCPLATDHCMAWHHCMHAGYDMYC
jgi:hypothetical protein